MVSICALCNTENKNLRSLAMHIKNTHKKYNSESYWREILQPQCSICGCPAKWRTANKFQKTCGKKDCLSQLLKSHRHSDQTKKKMRNARLRYLAEKKGVTAWERRAAGKMSWLEKWFFEKVILHHNLHNTYVIVAEHAVSSYAIDFAFPELMLAVELDGACHFMNGEKRVEHDLKRDMFLTKLGWCVYRIPYFDVRRDENKTVCLFLDFLQEGNFSALAQEPGYVRYAQWKKEQQKQKRKARTTKKTAEIQEKRDALLSEDIDFTRLGWVKQAARVLNMKYQHVPRWMKRHMASFYENSCYKRLPPVRNNSAGV